MSRPTAVPLPRGVLGGPRAAAPPVRLLLPWGLVGAAVLVQIVYPLVADAVRTEITVASVLVFCAASVCDAARVHGPRGAAVLLAVAGGGGLLVEAVGVHTGRPVRRLRLHRRPRRRGARRARGRAAGLDDDGLARAGRRPDARPSPAGGAGRRRGAGGVGPVPRPADGRRRALDVGAPAPRAAARARRAADELRGLAARRGGHGRDAAPGAAPPRPAVRPGRRALPVGLRVLRAGARRVLRPAGLGAGRRAGDGGARGALRALWCPPAASVRTPGQESPSASGLSAYSSDGSGCVAPSGRGPDGAVIVGSASWSPCA